MDYRTEHTSFLNPLSEVFSELGLSSTDLVQFAGHFQPVSAQPRSEACGSDASEHGAILGNIRKTCKTSETKKAAKPQGERDIDEFVDLFKQSGFGSADVGKLRLFCDKSTGEVQVFERNRKGDYVPFLTRGDLLQRKYRLQSLVQSSMPGHRVCNCGRKRINKNDEDVKVLKDSETGHCHVGNVQQCGEVWHCPVCALKVCARRREMWQKLIDSHQAVGGKVFMMTFTHSHRKADSLQNQIDGLNRAFTSFWRSTEVKRWRGSAGVLGNLRTLEITWSERNGWHAHYHVLFLTGSKNSSNVGPLAPWSESEFSIKKSLFPAWEKFSVKKGLGKPSFKHGLDVKESYSAEDYATKFGEEALSDKTWSAASEMTAGFRKGHRSGGFTPFALLVAFDQLKNSECAKYQLLAKQLYAAWKEYASVEKGKMSQPSQGLYDLYDLHGVTEITDEELVSVQDTPSIELGSIKWPLYVALRESGLFTSFLLAAENSWDAALRIVDLALSRSKPRSSDIERLPDYINQMRSRKLARKQSKLLIQVKPVQQDFSF